MAEINSSTLSKFKEIESFDKDLILAFYNDEISLNKEDFPSEDDYLKIMHQLIALLSSKTPAEIIDILKPFYIHKEVKAPDIPQYSDLSSALYLTPEILQSLNYGDLSYEDMGKQLWPTERLSGADMKYGENHAKTASQIGLTSVNRGKINITSFGKIFLSLNPVQQASLIPNLWLKVPLFYNYFCTNKSEQTLKQDINILSESTQKRRLSNVKTIIEIINKGYYLRENNLVVEEDDVSNNNLRHDFPLQQIYYGAPGTGKSFEIDGKTNDENSVRITFHPDSDYASFVGAYKPTMEDVPISAIVGKEVHAAVPQGNHTGKEKKIVYKYVPQAFLKAYVAAWSDLSKPQYLVIEEINRGNCAQIFGDLFQLLDRNNSGASSYPIHADEDISQFLKDDKKGFAGLSNEQRDAISSFVLEKDNGDKREIGQQILDGEVLLLPPNLYIWATMNTSDQSLFPIDSAFKRRWDWKYIPISYEPKDKKTGKEISWKFNIGEHLYSWGDFLKKINPEIYTLTESSDKQMGYFFAKAKPSTGIISEDVFLNKVLFYLWTEVLKDYNTGQEIFINPDTKRTFIFTDFFDEKQNALQNFIDKLELDELDDDDIENINSSSEGKVFIINGNKSRTITYALYLMLRDAAKTKTFAEIEQTITSNLSREGFEKSTIKKIDNPQDYKKENGWHNNIIQSSDGVSFVVTNQWKKELVPDVIKLGEALGVKIDFNSDTDENTSQTNLGLSTTKKWYVDLLTEVRNKYLTKGYKFQAVVNNYIAMATGISGMELVNRVNKRGSSRVELWIQPDRATRIFDILSQHKEEIENHFGTSLTWIETEESDGGNKHAEISYIKDGIDYNNLQEYNDSVDWLFENGIKLFEAVKPYFGELK